MRLYRKSIWNGAGDSHQEDASAENLRSARSGPSAAGRGKDAPARQGWGQSEPRAIAQSQILDCCDYVRDAIDRLEKLLSAPAALDYLDEMPAKPKPAHRGTRFEAEEPAPVQMRDMTNFILSREGDHFLNMLRQVIREEIDSKLSEKAEITEEPERQDEFERLRSLIRQGRPHIDTRRRA